MTLTEIQEQIRIAAQRLREINPRIKCYMVVMLSHSQFMASEIVRNNIKLLSNLHIFAEGQKITKLNEKLREHNRIEKENDGIRKKGLIGKKSLRKVAANEKKLIEIRANLECALEKLQFVEPQCELRFASLDMEAIQEIKAHPVIQAVGKSNMSKASIRVIIG